MIFFVLITWWIINDFHPSGPSYMVSGTQSNPLPEATLASVPLWKCSPCRPSRRWPCIIIHNHFGIIKCTNVPLSLSFPRSFDHSAEWMFTSLIQISALNPKSGHYATLATPRVVPVRRAIALILRKAVPLARVTLPAEAKQLAHSSCLAPDGFALVEFCKEIS